jgi:peptidoglycan/LPS O-acetylase OafA/YrhL
MSTLKRNQEVDALRGIAVLLVLLAHLRVLVPVDWAVYEVFKFEAGVPLFFAISGAVISGSLIPRLREGRYGRAFAAFYIRRAFRILPLAYLWLLAGLGGTLYFNRHGSFGDLHANLYGAGAAVLNLANVAQAKVVILGMGMFGAYWSLSLEEQFYLVFPLFLVLTPARWRAALLGFVLLFLAILWRKPAGFTLQDAFAIDSILFGILAYLVGPRLQWHRNSGRFAVFALLFLLLAAPLRIWNSGVAYSAVGLLSGLTVLMALAARGYVPDPAGILSWVGRRSYGLYLAHGPCIAFALELQLEPAMRCAVWLALTFGTTELLYRGVERPLIEAGRRRAHVVEGAAHAPAAVNALGQT